jgi:rhamnosyl/mannosyltransferase
VRVLFLTKYYPPSEGGIERYGHLLCTGLARRGEEVEVVAFGEDRKPASSCTVDGVLVHRLPRHLNPGRAPFSLALLPLLRRLGRHCDLVHLNYPNPWAEVCHLAMTRHRPTVLSYHSDIGAERLLRWVYVPFSRALLSSVNAVIASSPRYLASSAVLSSFSAKCRVIPYPVDPAYLVETDPTVVAGIQAEHGPFVLFTGRLVHYKGLEYLIEALAQLPSLRLLVAGRGPEEERYRSVAAAFGVADRVVFLGRVSDDRLRTLYQACVCFVLPSVTRLESFGIVLAEAMACGAPVISTELDTGTSFVNQDGRTGFVVPPRDAPALADRVGTLARNPRLAGELGRNARRRAAELCSQESVVEQTVQLYREVLAA